jgi:hypothetical protein
LDFDPYCLRAFVGLFCACGWSGGIYVVWLGRGWRNGGFLEGKGMVGVEVRVQIG